VDRRSFLSSVAALGLTAIARAGDKEQPPSPDIDGLIKQLGSRKFCEREAASKALEKVGKPALERLRRAAKDDPDAEVRRRAGALVERAEQRLAPVLAMRIIRSQLTPREKGQRLQRFIKRGMARKQVWAILGRPNVFARDPRSFIEEFYLRFHLTVHYDQDINVQKVTFLDE
jgi:hypothetical protein